MAASDSAIVGAQRRLLVQAIVKGNAAALYDQVAEAQPPLTQELAAATFRQAFLADVARGEIGARMRNGGLAHATWLGLSEAQHGGTNLALAHPSDEARLPPTPRHLPTHHMPHSPDTPLTTTNQVHGDNCVTIAAQVAIETDDVRVLDTLLFWQPSFRIARLAPKSSRAPDRPPRASLHATIEFFDKMRAPTCARRLRERRHELADAARIEKRHRCALQRLEKAATELLVPCRAVAVMMRSSSLGSGFEDVRVSVLEDIEADPRIRVAAMDDSAFSIGFALLGRPELVVKTGPALPHKRALLALRNLTDRALLEDSHAAAGVEPAGVAIKHHAFLSAFVEPFTPLRPPHEPPCLLIKVDA